MFLPIGDQPNPRGTPFINYALIAANVGVFLLVSLPLMMQSADPNDPLTQAYLRSLMERFPNFSPEMLHHALGQVSAYDVFLTSWGYRPAAPSLVTLLTSMFLHGGWMHLLGNMLFLWIYGDNVEHRLGRIGYLLAYVGTGLLAAVGYGLFASASAGKTPMVGASGAISGVLGFYFLWFPRNKVRILVVLFPFYFDVWAIGARFVLGFYLIVDNLLPFFLRSANSSGGVAYGAHIGGFVAGLVGGYLLSSFTRHRERNAALRDHPPPDAESTARAEQAVAAFRGGDTIRALELFLRLRGKDRRLVPTETGVGIADWLAVNGQADAALAVYGRVLEDHPQDPIISEAYLGLALVLLHHKHRPTAAYQYLMDALEAKPSAEVEREARNALAEIDRMQKLSISPRRPN